MWRGVGLHLGLSLFHGDSLSWHWRQWSIVMDTILAVTLTLVMTNVTNAFPQTSSASYLNSVLSDQVYSHDVSLCAGLTEDECTLYAAILILKQVIGLFCV